MGSSYVPCENASQNSIELVQFNGVPGLFTCLCCANCLLLTEFKEISGGTNGSLFGLSNTKPKLSKSSAFTQRNHELSAE